jgi:hypothetical protein
MVMDEKKENNQQAQAMAWTLVGIVILITCTFYLINSGDPYLQGMTWRTLSESIGYFIGILLFFSNKDLATYVIDGEEGFTQEDKDSDGSAPESVVVYRALKRMLVNYVTVMGLLYLVKKKATLLNSIGVIGAHVIAFSSADFFGLLQESPPFNESTSNALLVAPLVFVLGMCLRFIGDRARKKVHEHSGGSAAEEDPPSHDAVDVDHEEAEAAKVYVHQCAHTEDEFMAFTCGLLISQVCRYRITGKLPPMYGYKKTIKFELVQIKALLGCAVAFGIIEVLLGTLRRTREAGELKAMLATLQAIFSMSMAWCLHFWSEWLYYYMADVSGALDIGMKMVGKVYMALIFTPFSFTAIVLGDKIADKFPALEGLRAMNEGFVMLIGLAWEKTFMQAMSCIEVRGTAKEDALMKAGISYGIVAFVVPAWALFILPRSVKFMHEHEHEHEDQEHGGHHKEEADGEKAEENMDI